jgi:hypothetical protein
MGKWLLRRSKKESRACYSCGNYKMQSIFFDWHHHPSLKFLGEGRIGVICTPCARREAGSRNWSRVK